ncbi:hypothetical protein L288_08990 [Sphingobium quisquiliarum P25]|uniref:Cytochrome c domain-containing protein n=1 Tax=Sphingobium quisquiliarum P25 TaxID=1329909 RepID=T0H7H1_9SPHN|nr:c-type cytochrome [Sphingobium quisquiliarum]EQB08053.1 hypothetical protein L288_08990 [Sphingobium quisquiliarum P25]
MRTTIIPALIAAAAAFVPGVADAAPATEPAPGKIIFQRRCAACHSVLGDGIGPDLRGVFGRKSGGADGFRRYSPAMQKAGVVWDAPTLKRYLAAPSKMVPGNRMLFPGMTNASEIDQLVAFLKAYR